MPRVSARVMGRDIYLNTELDELHINSVVQYVDEQWRDLISKTKEADTQKLAALTAIQIAAELLEIQGKQKNISDNYEKKINELIKLLDETGFAG